MISSDELAGDARLELAANCCNEAARCSLGRGLWQIYVNGRQQLGCGFVSQQDVMRMEMDRYAPGSREAQGLKEMT